jgi:hypothetical protein
MYCFNSVRRQKTFASERGGNFSSEEGPYGKPECSGTTVSAYGRAIDVEDKPVTEDEWLHSADFKAMMAFIRGRVSERKIRLLAAACGLCNEHRMKDRHYRSIVEVEERYAAGMTSIEAVVAAYDEICDDMGDALDAAYFDPYENAVMLADRAAECAHLFGSTWEQVRRTECDLLRDIMGNPFSPPEIRISSKRLPRRLLDVVGNFLSPSIARRPWTLHKDSELVAMAQDIYDQRSFDYLPALAEELEQAGCTCDAVLKHCRGLGPHVRGCWVVDLLLGRS